MVRVRRRRKQRERSGPSGLGWRLWAASGLWETRRQVIAGSGGALDRYVVRGPPAPELEARLEENSGDVGVRPVGAFCREKWKKTKGEAGRKGRRRQAAALGRGPRSALAPTERTRCWGWGWGWQEGAQRAKPLGRRGQGCRGTRRRGRGEKRRESCGSGLTREE